MLLYVLAFLGGVLTIVSPCILPVLPFVFSRADQPFRRSGLPLLAGMAFTFALVAAVATFAGSWVVRANQVGRYVAVVGASAHTIFLLLAFAAGAASSLALALLAGNRVFGFMKRSLAAEEWIRRGLGVAVLIGVVAVAFG